MPLLGVCLGHQGIAALNGAPVDVIPMPVHGRASSVRHDGSVLFEGIPSPFSAARYHSLVAVRPLPLALAETAWTEDGFVMALAHRYRPQWGVQFHPESIITDCGRRLIENFRDATLRSAPRLVAVERSVPARTAWWRELPQEVDAEAAFVALFGDAPTAFWLDSGCSDPQRARWSYFGDAGGGGALVEYETAGRRLVVTGAAGPRTEALSIFSYFSGSARRRRTRRRARSKAATSAGSATSAQRMGSPSIRRARTPDALFVDVRRYVAVDHVERRTYVVAIDEPDARRSTAWVDDTAERLASLAPAPAIGYGTSDFVRFRLDRDRQTHVDDVERSLRWIGEGESYRICLTNEHTCDVRIPPLALYRVMRGVNPAPYGAYLRWPGGAVLSGSPERFLSLDAGGRVETKPIKGTIRRGADAESDARLVERLRGSEKDRAENTMIVDLLRNDLSRVCEPGSVACRCSVGLESFATVHQFVSTVRGRLARSTRHRRRDPGDVPRRFDDRRAEDRALGLIDELERRARGVYSGTLGWIG